MGHEKLVLFECLNDLEVDVKGKIPAMEFLLILELDEEVLEVFLGRHALIKFLIMLVFLGIITPAITLTILPFLFLFLLTRIPTAKMQEHHHRINITNLPQLPQIQLLHGPHPRGLLHHQFFQT